jgi:beta-lactamase class A
MALSLYRHAEKNPGFLASRIQFANTSYVDSNKNQYFKPAAQALPGNYYSVKELIQYMLEDSDNGALFLLGSQLDDQELQNAYSDLGIIVPDMPAPGYSMDVKTYASFFRVLFSAGYLSRDSSEELLSILAQSTFSQGLQAGVPKGTTVAHKFGEYTVNPQHLQLHDCGIIYKPHNPYLLCIMTHGTDFDKLAGTIAHISKIVYATLDQ